MADESTRTILELAALLETEKANRFLISHMLTDAREHLCISAINGYRESPRYTIEQQRQILEYAMSKNSIRNYKLPDNSLEVLSA